VRGFGVNANYQFRLEMRYRMPMEMFLAPEEVGRQINASSVLRDGPLVSGSRELSLRDTQGLRHLRHS
jgi:hypothetical protein